MQHLRKLGPPVERGKPPALPLLTRRPDPQLSSGTGEWAGTALYGAVPVTLRVRWPDAAHRPFHTTLVLCLVKEDPNWGYRRLHGELATVGSKIALSTAVWEILKADGIDPAPQCSSTTWAAFLRSQAIAVLACDFIETITLTGSAITSSPYSSTPTDTKLGTTDLTRGTYSAWLGGH
jgi:hypothetical protein